MEILARKVMEILYIRNPIGKKGSEMAFRGLDTAAKRLQGGHGTRTRRGPRSLKPLLASERGLHELRLGRG